MKKRIIVGFLLVVVLFLVVGGCDKCKTHLDCSDPFCESECVLLGTGKKGCKDTEKQWGCTGQFVDGVPDENGAGCLGYSIDRCGVVDGSSYTDGDGVEKACIWSCS